MTVGGMVIGERAGPLLRWGDPAGDVDECKEGELDQGEMAKLKVLLEFWIKHNSEHEAEFEEWAEKARDLHGGAVASGLLEARDCMRKASGSLSDVINRLRVE